MTAGEGPERGRGGTYSTVRWEEGRRVKVDCGEGKGKDRDRSEADGMIAESEDGTL